MSIPERLYRIARYKLGEIKDRLDRMDEERELEAELRRRQADSRADARRELTDALNDPNPPAPPQALPTQAPPPRRTPQEIAQGMRPAATAPPVAPSAASSPDPLAFHYKLLGVETGADFATVQAAYNRLAARAEPSRFPAGSPEEQQSQAIRTRLDESFRALRDALDPTARRFDLLEFDSPGAGSQK